MRKSSRTPDCRQAGDSGSPSDKDPESIPIAIGTG